MPFPALAIPSFLTNKFVGIGAIFLTLIVTFFLFKATFETRALTKERDKLSVAIGDPKTGYIARLTQARANEALLEVAIKTQNESFTKESNASKAELARLKKELQAAQVRTRVAEKRLQLFLAVKPRGATLIERVNDIDQRVLKDLQR